MLLVHRGANSERNEQQQELREQSASRVARGQCAADYRGEGEGKYLLPARAILLTPVKSDMPTPVKSDTQIYKG